MGLLVDLCCAGLLGGAGGGAAAAVRAGARRHPAKVWLLPLPVAALTLALVAATDAAATAAHEAISGADRPPLLGVQLLLGAVCAALTVPQRRCVRLGAPLVACCVAAVVGHCQYATAVALATYPRPLALCCVGLPNLALSAYVGGLWLAHVGLGWWWRRLGAPGPPPGGGALRPALWAVFTGWAPALLVTQALVPLVACPLRRGAAACAAEWVGGG